MASIFFRLLKEENKEAALRRFIADLQEGRPNGLTHTMRQETFALLPGSPMPYWVSDAMRRKLGINPQAIQTKPAQAGWMGEPASAGLSFVARTLTSGRPAASDATLRQRFLAWLAVKEAAEVQVVENSYRIDQAVLDLYDISPEDQWAIDRELGAALPQRVAPPGRRGLRPRPGRRRDHQHRPLAPAGALARGGEDVGKARSRRIRLEHDGQEGARCDGWLNC